METPPSLTPTEWAYSLRTRLQSGEKVSPEELKQFLGLAGKAILSDRKTKVEAKPTDVDFF